MHSLCERPARPAGFAWNLTKTTAQITVCWTLFFLLVPMLIVRAERMLGLHPALADSAARSAAALVAFIALGALGLASAWVFVRRGRGTPLPFDTTRELVVAGPYRFVRNPMAIAGIGQGAAVAVLLGSPIVLAYAGAAILVWNYGIRPWEERQLTARFGQAYLTYRRRVRCWRPRLRGYDLEREAAEPVLSDERTVPPGVPTLIYDGACRFCRNRLRALRRFTGGVPLATISYHDERAMSALPGLRLEACSRAMYFVSADGRVYEGFEAGVRAIALRGGIGQAAMAYYVPGVRLACDLLYAWVAKRRYRFGGRCDASGCTLATNDP
jgi:protein-S-isoprenylcysteine O-methyltransferase Ste14/predicted DCC family thiol-disulfide oxidoreductase YuxK